MRRFNEWLALHTTRAVGTMGCAYAFAVLAILGLPQAIHDSIRHGPLPLVTWLSQSFLQLVLLSIIMVGTTISLREQDARAAQDHAALMELVSELHAKHDAAHPPTVGG